MMQYLLPLTLPEVFSAENFFVSDANREPYQWVTTWPDWPTHALLIHGPHGCGKSHLAQLWAARAQAVIESAAAITDLESQALQGHRVIEDIERAEDERLLLHLFNATRENGHSLLLTATAWPLPFRLPDLLSRLRALPLVAIGQPDDALLAGVLRKQFADRQIIVEEGVIAYMLPRMPRSLHEARKLVAKLDECALAERRGITVPFVRRWL